MKKLALFLALMTAPLCAESYVTVGTGPYLLIPNFGVGSIEQTEQGEVDYNANISLTYKSIITEAKVSYHTVVDDYYFGPSVYASYEKIFEWKGNSSVGAGVVLGKKLGDSFVDVSFEKDIITSNSSDVIPKMKIRYGVFF